MSDFAKQLGKASSSTPVFFNLNVAKFKNLMLLLNRCQSFVKRDLSDVFLCFNKGIVPSMFKHVASENGPLVLILQSYSQIFIVKHIDLNLAELVCTTKKLLSPTLPKLMNWILLSPPPLSSDTDNPQNLERAHGSQFWIEKNEPEHKTHFSKLNLFSGDKYPNFITCSPLQKDIL